MALSDRTKANIALLTSIVAALFSLPAALDVGYRFFVDRTPAIASSQDEVVSKYLQMLTSGDSRTVTGAASYAAPGSPAFQYATSRKVVIAAWNDNERELTSTTFEQRGEAKAYCGPKSCTEYTDFTYDELLRIRDFQVNGVPAGALIIAPFDEPTNRDVGIATRLEGGYVSTVSDRTWLSIDIKSLRSAKIAIDYGSMVFRDSKNVDHEANAYGPPELTQAQRGRIGISISGTSRGWLGFNTAIEGSEDQFLWIEIV